MMTARVGIYNVPNPLKITKLNRPALLQLKDKKNLVGAEIGVQYGLNAGAILKTLDIEKLYLIDPYGTYKEKRLITSHEAQYWQMNAKRLLIEWEEKTIWIQKRSVKAVKYIKDNSLDFVYIDGGHLYKNVTEDIESYMPKVKMGGLIAGHDYNKKQVKRAIDDMYGDKVTVENCLKIVNPNERGIDWWVWKDEDIINR